MHSEIAEEKLLVSQFSQGSHIAFKALFMRYYPKVRSFIMGLVKSCLLYTSDAADEL